MVEPRLEQALRMLHKELQDAEGIEDSSRLRLEQLIDEIEQGLDKIQQDDYHQGLVDSLSNEVTLLEVSHPKLTAAANELLLLLSAGGF